MTSIGHDAVTDFRRDPSSNHRIDVGQATMLVLAAIVLAMTVAWGAAMMSVRLVDRGRAQTAADAAALAGAAGGYTAAARAAGLNDATLSAFVETVGTVTAVVERGGETAVARASNLNG